jgi:hypothetical protein
MMLVIRRFGVGGVQSLNCRGVEPPSCLLNPQTRCPGGQFQPPAVVNDAESPVCNDNE